MARSAPLLTYQNQTRTQRDWARRLGLPENTISRRRHRHPDWPAEALLGPPTPASERHRTRQPPPRPWGTIEPPGTYTLLTAEDVAPERELIAALLRGALTDARYQGQGGTRGKEAAEARQWLQEHPCCITYLLELAGCTPAQARRAYQVLLQQAGLHPAKETH